MNARQLPDPAAVVPDPDVVLPPPLRQLMFDAWETGILVGIIPETADRSDPRASGWRQKVHALRTTGRLPARHYGREWRWSAGTIREFVLGHDDPSVSRVAS